MKRTIIILILALTPFLAGAQALKGSYFLDNSLNRHELNPAFAPRANYFQLFGIGNLGLGIGSNLDIPTFFYPVNGELCTFLNSGVSIDKFERVLPRRPHFDTELNTTLLGFGFQTKNNSYWTFDLDVRAMVDVDLPGDLFLFLKKGTGTSGNSYNIGNINAYATAGLQASLGYSRDIIDGLRAGVKARFIAPLAYGALNFENVRLTTAADKWTLSTEGYLHAALQGADISIPEGETMPHVDFDLQRMLSNKVLAGWGVSFDLGAEYVFDMDLIIDGLTVSAAVTDLGLISYNQNAVSSFKSEGSVDWIGFQNINLDNAEFDASLEDFIEGAQENLINLKEIPSEGKFSRSTMPRFYLGVEMPFLNNIMSVGLLYSSRLSHSYGRHEMTLSYNLNPCKWFAFGLNYSFISTARTMGFILEFTPKWGPAFYIGGDYLPVSWAKAPLVMGESSFNMLPLGLKTNINFGIAFHTGSRHQKNKQ